VFLMQPTAPKQFTQQATKAFSRFADTKVDKPVNNINRAAHNWIKSLGWFSRGSKRTTTCEAPSDLAGSVTSLPTAGKISLSGAESFLRSQDAYLQQVDGALDQMSVLAAESQDDARTDEERAVLQAEFATLAGYITNIASAKDSNGAILFDGTLLIAIVPGNNSACKMPGVSLGLAAYTRATSARVTTVADARSAFQSVMAAITQLRADRASVVSSERQLFIIKDKLTALHHAAAKN
jgi:flagellin-like hook-associated protein FlgL